MGRGRGEVVIWKTWGGGEGEGESMWEGMIFFFQEEDGIRKLVRSRGLGDI